jgi:hypothetical protein
MQQLGENILIFYRNSNFSQCFLKTNLNIMNSQIYELYQTE